jgi:hypothetical protein
MESNRGDSAEVPTSGDARDVPADDRVVELRPIESLRVCPTCLVSNSANDVYCTGCGIPLSADAPGDSAEADPDDTTAGVTPSLPAPLPAEHAVTLSHMTFATPVPLQHAPLSRSQRWLVVLAGVLAVAAAAGAVAFALLWRSQSQHVERVQARLETTQGDLSRVETSLAKTQSNLTAVTSLAEKRRSVLVRTRDVLAQVDPLLSSVDAIQNKASDVRAQGDALSADADSLISTLATLVNYLVDTDADYVDWYYVGDLIDDANGELDSVRADETLFAADDASYNTASTRFGHKADDFSASVRLLQRQLKNVTTK